MEHAHIVQLSPSIKHHSKLFFVGIHEYACLITQVLWFFPQKTIALLAAKFIGKKLLFELDILDWCDVSRVNLMKLIIMIDANVTWIWYSLELFRLYQPRNWNIHSIFFTVD